MFTQTMSFLIRNLADFFVLLLLTRLYFQAAKVSFRHPLAHVVLSLTNWMVLPLRRVIPAAGRFDTTSFILAWFFAFLMHLLLLTLSPWPFILASPLSLAALMIAALLELVKMSLYLLFAAVIGQALMSWIAPYNPLMSVLNVLTAPFLRPLRRFIPPVGGVDITPLVLILLIQLLLNVFLSQLEPLVLQRVLIAA
ncbi:MAG: osmotic-shock protein [Proteobacteria bacterium]|nr:osmotic-shock protein [Pseudomonadota bacterium]